MANIAIFRINYKSDFILTLNSDAGWLTPFCIKFWTGAPSQAYFASFDGTTYTHCAPVEGEPTKLVVQFDDHHLPIGDLKFQIGYHFTVADFPTSVEDEVLNQASVIIEVGGEPAQVMLDFNGETAPEIEFSLPAYANEAQRIANEQARIAAEQQRIANEDARIQAEETRQYNEQQRIQHEEERVSEFARLKSESEAATTAANAAATLANEKAQLADDKATLAQAAATLANEKAQLAADKAALAQAAATLANEKAALAQQKATYAQTQGDYAKEQGDYAKAQGDTAQADHVRAEADHTTAADDHSRAEGDHTTAASDHSLAESDHTTAASDHSLAESDHTTAASDHSRAESDHTTSASDHTRAEADHTTAASDHETAASDHTRAESDHTAVEVYVDSLGAFDISAYHATGGVLAKYADLTAALGTDGANIPEALRKGGMSVKFVQSSDNKYIQAICMAQNFTTDVIQWQGVDDEPTEDSKNLVKSGGVYNPLNEIFSAIGKRTNYSVNASSTLTTITLNVQANCKYRIIPINRTWNVSNITESSVVFALYVGEREISKIRKNSFTSLEEYYDIELSSSENTASIDVRGNSGQTLEFILIDKQDTRFGEYDDCVKETTKLAKVIDTCNIKEVKTFIGNNNASLQYDFAVEQNKNYYIFPFVKTWDVSNVDAGNHVFTINVGSETIVDFTRQGTSISIAPYYIVNSGSNNVIHVVVRATKGTDVVLGISEPISEDDITGLAKKISTLQSLTSQLNTNLGLLDTRTNNNEKNIHNIALELCTSDSHTFNGANGTKQEYDYNLLANNSYVIKPTPNVWDDSSVSSGTAVYQLKIDGTTVVDIRKGEFPEGGIPEYSITPNANCTLHIVFRGTLNVATTTVGFYNLSSARLDGIDMEFCAKYVKTLNGQNGTIQRTYYEVTKGDYILKPNHTTWQVDNIATSDAVVFGVYVGSTEVYKVRKNAFTSIPSEFDITVPQGENQLTVEYRGNVGEDIELSLLSKSEKRFDQIQEEIDELNNTSDILRLHPKEQVLPVLANFKKLVDSNNNSYGLENLVLLHFSDLHSEVTPLKRIIEFKNAFSSYIDDTILTGDIVNRQSDSFSFWTENGANDILTCIGNHEILVYGDDTPEIGGVKLKEPFLFSGKYCYERYLAPFVSDTGITIETDKAYWYKDYSELNIRIIALDYMHWKDAPTLVDNTPVTTYPDGGSVDTGQQRTWFHNTLESARTLGYSVIVLDHATPSIGNRLNCSFDSLDVSGLVDRNWAEVTEDVETFITNGGEFITYLCGHTHTDQIGTVQNHPNQLTMTIDTSRVELLNGEIKKVPNTNSEDLFNLVCVNTNMKLLTFYRIGSNWDRVGRPINSLIVNYQTKNIVWNS